MIAQDLLPRLEAEARERRIALSGSWAHPDEVPQLIAEPQDEPISIESRTIAAELTGTNRQYVSDAKRIVRDDPDLHPDSDVVQLIAQREDEPPRA
jgi:hypothetical protein